MIKKIYLILSLILILPNGSFAISPPKDLYVKELVQGKGKKIIFDKGNRVSVFMKVWAFNQNSDTKDFCEAKGDLIDSIFGKNNESTKLFSFPIGEGKLIKGWEEGLQNMRVGERRCLVTPPNYAYGNRNVLKSIPKNATLIFEVDLFTFER